MEGGSREPGPSPAAAETIFSAALALPLSERADYLASACGGDPRLRHRVEALLRAHDAPEGFLPEQPGTPLAAVSSAAFLAAQLTEQPGDVIGRYKLRQKIGEGGCGVVYMAEQEQPVRRRVALKVIKLGMDTRQVVTRFEAERQALALMDHPNIARVIDAGATETGRPYFVMELVGGIKITDYCEQNQLDTRQRLDLFIQVCRAIQHAHQKGVIHRDLKPSNVLVAIQDGVPVPKVIDFGIAKATQGRLTDQTVFTAFEQFIGTPAYMSPEQAQLGGLDVDTRSDIYSLGVLLYELLTGKTPFEPKELLSMGLDGMRRTIQEKEPQTPSTRLKQELATAKTESGKQKAEINTRESIRLLKGDLDWIVMKCLEKDRGRRYETANGLASDIQRHLNNEPVVARPPSRLYEFQKTVRRHKFGFAATAAVIVALSCGVVTTSLEAVRARQAGREAQAALRSSYLSEARALRISGQAGRHFESLATLRKAAAIQPTLALSGEALLALRNEAIASMILPDIQWLGGKDFTKTGEKVCLDPTFERYAVCDRTGAVTVRRAEDDRAQARLPAAASPAKAPWCFSPDGKLLVVSYTDGHWRVWDWSKPAIVLDVGFLGCFGFTPDSRSFVISDTTNIVVHDLLSVERLESISLGGLCSPDSPGNFLFDPSGQRLALFLTEADTNVTVLDLHTGQTPKTLPHPGHVWSVGWHPNGEHLATGCGDGVIRIWDPKSGKLVREWRSESMVSLAFNHRGDMLATSDWDGYTRLWEFENGRQLISIYKSGHVVFSADDLRLVSGGWEGTLLDFFEVTVGHGLRTLYEAREPLSEGGGIGPIVDTSGRLLAFRTLEGIGLWDFQTGRQISSAKFESGMNPVGFDKDGQNLILSRREGLFRCPIIKSGADGSRSVGEAVLVGTEYTCPGGGRVSANGEVYAVSDGNRCQFFLMKTLQKRAETGVQRGMRYSDINSDGSLFASGTWQHPGVKVWDTQTGALVKELATRIATATTAFSPDGRFLVTGINDEYCFWEVGSWSVARRIPQEPGNDFSPMMAFSRNGKILAGTHSRNKIRLHDAATGKVLADLTAPTSRMITGLVFNRDGTLLAAAESRDALRLWDLRRIRQQLAELGLDWDQPAFPESEPSQVPPKEPVAAAATSLRAKPSR